MLNVPRCFNIRSLNQTSIWTDALGPYKVIHRSIRDVQTNTNKRKTLTVCPWNVLMGRSCPSLQTWIHMSVLQEANVLLLCQSTSSAGAVGGRRTDREICKYWKTLQPFTDVTTLRHNIQCFVPEWKGNCCLASPVWASQMIVVCRDTQTCTVTEHQLDPFTHELHATRVRVRHRVGWFTLSTPALRIKLPFLFHLRAKMGPLCWPSVLARFPVEHKHEHNL